MNEITTTGKQWKNNELNKQYLFFLKAHRGKFRITGCMSTSDKLVDAREYGANKIKDAVRIKQTIRINRCEKKKNRINQI